MERIVLITDIDTPLGYALARFYIKDSEKVIGTVSSQNPDLPFKELDKDEIDIIEWQRTSPVDSKNLMLTILKKYKKLDEALIIQSIESKSMKLHETNISEIDKEIDFWLKGLIFLCREIIKTFISGQSGIIVFINYLTSEQSVKQSVKHKTSCVFEAIRHGIGGFMNQVLHSYQKEFKVNTIESSFVAEDILSTYIYKNIKERLRGVSGKKLKFQQKLSLFSGLRKSG